MAPVSSDCVDTTLLLRVEPKGVRPFAFRCEHPSVVIGRSATADLHIPQDEFLSRRHARIYRDHERWYIEDLDSQNETALNGRRLRKPRRLRAGDSLKLSECAIHVRAVIADGETPDGAGLREGSDPYRSSNSILEQSDSGELTKAGTDAELFYLANRLQVLHQAHQALATPVNREELLEVILECTFAALLPEEATIFVRKPGEPLTRAATRRLPQLSGQEFFYSQRLADEVVDKRAGALVLDARNDERFSDSDSFVDLGVRSVIAAPLLDPEECSGLIILSSRKTVRQFSSEDMELLVSLASVAALRLKHIALADEATRRREFDREIERARQIQVALLPESLPSIPGYSMSAINRPSRTVSGDLYRFEERVAHGEYSVLVADVSGKGLAASLVTASLEALAAGPMEMGRPPDDVLTKLSRRLYLRTPSERFATAFFATLDIRSGRVRYASAGHNAALWIRDREIVELEGTGTPLGLLPDASYGVEEFVLDFGETLAIYTDGITDTTSRDDEDFGMDRLKATCRTHAQASVEQIASGITDGVESFADGVPYADDQTLVVIRRDRP